MPGPGRDAGQRVCGQVTSWINGVLQNQCTALNASGHIGLQSEGGPLKIRAVRLRPAA